MRKAKRKGQRVLAAALCVGMLASMVPAQAFANDEPITAIVQQEDTPADADAPAEDTYAGQIPAPTEAPVADETEPPAEKTPNEAPDAEGTPAPTETPVETETPAPTEAPAADETPAPATTIQESGDADATDVTLPNAEAGRYERLTIRAQTGMNWNNSGYTLEINGAGSWKLFRIGTQVANGTVAKNAEGKYDLKLIGLGSTVYAYIDDVRVAKYNDANPMLSGRVKISSNWKQVYADNLEVKTVKGGMRSSRNWTSGQASISRWSSPNTARTRWRACTAPPPKCSPRNSRWNITKPSTPALTAAPLLWENGLGTLRISPPSRAPCA